MPATATARFSWRRVGIWALRILVAMVLFYEGTSKFSTSRLWTMVFARIGLGNWFRYTTGAIETIGAILLLVPRTTTFAVAVLAATMIGALLTHVLVIGVGPQSVLVGLLFGSLLVIGRNNRA